MSIHERAIVGQLLDRLGNTPGLIQIITGPRQVGKTTAARQVQRRWDGPSHYASADSPLPPGPEWIETQWQVATGFPGDAPMLLILDEVQKVRGWSEAVKALWDANPIQQRPIRLMLLGSSALSLARGSAESLAGRFFLHRCLHWSYAECQEAFGWDLDRWLFFGGYPGAAPLADEEQAWRAYINDSLIEAALARDVLAMHNIAKPALLRQLFLLAASYPAQMISYTKLLGQLQDAGNTTTLAHYLRLLEGAFLLSGLQRYSGGQVRKRGSSPKLVLWNNALVNAVNLLSFAEARADASWWGRVVENAVGAHLANHLQGLPYELLHWRARNDEVDYVVQAGKDLLALEVKSGRAGRAPGLAAFRRKHPHARALVVGTGGMELETFFERDPRGLFG